MNANSPLIRIHTFQNRCGNVLERLTRLSYYILKLLKRITSHWSDLNPEAGKSSRQPVERSSSMITTSSALHVSRKSISLLHYALMRHFAARCYDGNHRQNR